MDAAMLYESPYTDFHPQGVDGVFGAVHSGELVAVINAIRDHVLIRKGFFTRACVVLPRSGNRDFIVWVDRSFPVYRPEVDT